MWVWALASSLTQERQWLRVRMDDVALTDVWIRTYTIFVDTAEIKMRIIAPRTVRLSKYTRAHEKDTEDVPPHSVPLSNPSTTWTTTNRVIYPVVWSWPTNTDMLSIHPKLQSTGNRLVPLFLGKRLKNRRWLAARNAIRKSSSRFLYSRWLDMAIHRKLMPLPRMIIIGWLNRNSARIHVVATGYARYVSQERLDFQTPRMWQTKQPAIEFWRRL
jgi:hypothetical protein